MINFRDKFVKFRRDLIVEHDDVMLVLENLDEIKRESRFFTILMDMEIGNCGWAHEPSKWFIQVDMTNEQWDKLIDKLACDDRQIILKNRGRFYLV